MKRFYVILLCMTLGQTILWGQNAAVSSHTNFGTDITGDITISEVRVPREGLTTNTYYETLGFWGNKGNATGNGYGGIQESSDGRGNKVHIFSIWHALDNPNDTANFPYAVHLAYGMRAEYFGGEGVGLKTWNLTNDPTHPLYWETDVWYTHVVRTWDVGNHTYYGFFVRDGKKGIWRHLSTIGVRESSIRIKGKNDAFIEDWSGSGHNMREIHLRNNWRRDLSGNWQAAQKGAYSVNDWDLAPGKRSYNYRYNWNGGTRSDATGEYYFMTTGGSETAPTPPLNFPNKTSNTYYIDNSASDPGFSKALVSQFVVDNAENGKLALSWEMDSTTLPLFSYSIVIFDNAAMSGSPLLSKSAVTPHVRMDTLDISSLDIASQKYYVRFSVQDIFDNQAETKEATFGNGEVTPYITLLTPNGGETFLHNDSMSISWKSNQSDSCIIKLINTEEDDYPVATVAMNQSPYTWPVSDMLAESDKYKISITLKTDLSTSDVSNTTFTISAPDSANFLFDQSKLNVHSFDSEQDNSANAANNVLDGDPQTIWHTDWSTTAVPPHEIVLKADKAYSFSGLLYLPRQDGGTNGFIKEYEIYLSSNGTTWGQAVTSGEFAASGSEKRIEFTPQEAQYIKLVALSEANNQAFTSAAELNLLYDINGGSESSIQTDQTAHRFSVEQVQGKFHLSLPDREPYRVTLSQLNGRQLMKKNLQGKMYHSIEVPYGVQGVCVISIRGSGVHHSERILIP